MKQNRLPLGSINKAFIRFFLSSLAAAGGVRCMPGRHVSSPVTKRFLGCGFIEGFQAELGCGMLLVLWYWYRAGFFSAFVCVGGGKLFQFLSPSKFFQNIFIVENTALAHNTSPPAPPASFHSYLKRVSDFLVTSLQKT